MFGMLKARLGLLLLDSTQLTGNSQIVFISLIENLNLFKIKPP